MLDINCAFYMIERSVNILHYHSLNQTLIITGGENMKTGKEYIESIKAMNFELYIDGGKINNVYDHPHIRPAIDAVAETYDFASQTGT